MAAIPLLIAALLQCPPPADVVPGVSAQGWAVAPAELPESPPELLGDITLNLELPASDYSQNDLLAQHFPYATIDLGDVTVSNNGNVELNERPMHTVSGCE